MPHLRWVAMMMPVLLSACHLVMPFDRLAADGSPREGGADSLQVIDNLQPADGWPGCSGLSGVQICEDFEDPWTKSGYILVHGPTTVDPERVPQGYNSKYALRAQSGPADDYSQAQHFLSSKVATGTLSIQAYVNVSLTPIPPKEWVTVFQFFGNMDYSVTKAGFELGSGPEAHVHCPTGGWLNESGVPMSQGTWHHVELRADMDTRQVTLWINGNLVESCNPDDVVFPPGGFDTVAFGVGTHVSTAAITLDNVVITRPQ